MLMLTEIVRQSGTHMSYVPFPFASHVGLYLVVWNGPINSRPLLDPYAREFDFVWWDLTVTIYAPSGSYPDGTGLKVVREDIAKFLERRDGHPADPRHIFMGNGATDGIEVHVYYNSTLEESSLFIFPFVVIFWLWVFLMQSQWILLSLRNPLLWGSALESTCGVLLLFYPICWYKGKYLFTGLGQSLRDIPGQDVNRLILYISNRSTVECGRYLRRAANCDTRGGGGGGRGRGNSHMKRSWMLVIPCRGQNLSFWYCSGY